MSRVRVTGGPGVIGSRVVLRLLAAGRQMRAMGRIPTPAAEVRAMLGPGEVQPHARVSFNAPGREPDTGRLDAAAGGEFIDDRIRVRA